MDILVARAEVELSGCESLNARLCLAFPERTLEAIKGLRRNPAYRALVNEIRSEGDRQMPDPAATAAAMDTSPSAGNHPGVSSEGSPEGGPGVPTSQEEAILELAEACHKDSGALCFSPEELEELIGLAVAAVRDPSAPSGQRIQALINKEYDQFVESLPIPKPENHPQHLSTVAHLLKGESGAPMVEVGGHALLIVLPRGHGL